MANAEIVARVLGDTTDLEQKLLTGEAKAKSFGQRLGETFSGIGAKVSGLFSAAALGVGAKSAIDYAGAMVDAAAATRTGVEEYQVLAFAAREAGASQQQLDKALVSSALNGEKAASGTREQAEAFAKLGINVAEFNRLSPELKLEALGRAYTDAGQSQAAFADISTILGEKAGPKLLDMLIRLGTEGFGKLRSEAEAAGNVMDAGLAQNLDKMGDKVEQFKVRAKNLFGEAIAGAQVIMEFLSGTNKEDISDKVFGDGRKAAARDQAVKELFAEGQLYQEDKGPGPWKTDAVRIEERMDEILERQAKKEQEAAEAAKERAAAYEQQAKAMEISAASQKVAAIIENGREAIRIKGLSTEEQLIELEKQRTAAVATMENLEAPERARVEAAREVLSLENQIAEVQKNATKDAEKKAKEKSKLEKQQADESQNNRDLIARAQEAGRVRPTINDLATGGVRGSSEARSLARRFQGLEDRERSARARGNEELADRLAGQRRGIGQRLQRFGVSAFETDPAAAFKEALTNSEAKLKEIKSAIEAL